jgi:GntR family transcriptional regulator/MocR family aminotransferase
VLAEFIAEGHLARHIRRMRSLYAERQAVFLRLCRSHLDGLLEVEPAEAGMQLMGWLPPGVDDQMVATELRAQGVVVAPLSVHYIGARPERLGLVMGYSGFTERQMTAAIQKVATVLREAINPKTLP